MAGEAEWSIALERIRAKHSGTPPDQTAIREILALYGGMGSLNDLVLYDQGRVLVQETERLDTLRRKLFDMAKSMLR